MKEAYHQLIRTNEAVNDFVQQYGYDGIWYWDLTRGEEAWLSDDFWETLQYVDPELRPEVNSWQDLIQEEDLGTALKRIERYLEDPIVPYDQVVHYLDSEGASVWLRCRGYAVRDERGRPTSLVGAHINVTTIKEKQNLLERAQSVARIGTWEVDLLGNKVIWDALTKKIHGVPHHYIPTLEGGINFYKEGTHRDNISKLFQRAVKYGEPFDTELQIITAHGREVWVRAMGQAEFLEGVCSKVYGVFQDIDQRKRGADRLLNFSILEAKSKEMEQFAYAASHDLREPLLTIRGYLDVIQEDHATELSSTVKDYLATVAGAAERMDSLIIGLMDYSRLSQIKQLQEVDLKALIEDVLVNLHSAIKNVDIQINYAGLPKVIGYPMELNIVFQNLLGNAIKYRKVNVPLTVDISCKDTLAGWQLSVADNGIGIAQKNLDAIFQLFRQLHNKGEFTGNGIGLANCQKVIELHGGKIWATSEVGQGTTIHFTLKTRPEISSSE